MNLRLVGSDVTGAEGIDSDAVRSPLHDISTSLPCRRKETYLNGELLDDRRGSGLGRVVEDLVDTLVDDLGRHGGGQDDRSLLVARLGPEIGGSLSTSELAPDVDVVCRSAM
jgi:hypothetical protein